MTSFWKGNRAADDRQSVQPSSPLKGKQMKAAVKRRAKEGGERGGEREKGVGGKEAYHKREGDERMAKAAGLKRGKEPDRWQDGGTKNRPGWL